MSLPHLQCSQNLRFSDQPCTIIKEKHLYRKAFYSASCPFVTTKDDLKALFFSFFLKILEKNKIWSLPKIITFVGTKQPLKNTFPVPHTFQLQWQIQLINNKGSEVVQGCEVYMSPDFIVCLLSRSFKGWWVHSQIAFHVEKPLKVPKDNILPTHSALQGKHCFIWYSHFPLLCFKKVVLTPSSPNTPIWILLEDHRKNC